MGRRFNTATLLVNGKVLVAGGYDEYTGVALSGAEVYDPTSGVWTATGPMTNARDHHTATLLPNGKVLVVGGAGTNRLSGQLEILSSAELYDPNLGVWIATGQLATARYDHTATLLSSGMVLVAGGDYPTPSRAELYDPSSWKWVPTGTLTNDRNGHSATLLPSGKVLVAGGWGLTAFFYGRSSAELYDPATGIWKPTSQMVSGRMYQTATLLPNGKLLVIGGSDGSGDLSSAELYDLATGTWAATGAMSTGRAYHTATLLPNGMVLVAGGGSIQAGSSAELYVPDIATNTADGIATDLRVASRTALVDLFFDLRGSNAAYSVSVSVSSDGGATFAIPATHFSGDGVSGPVTPGIDRHIVWDAGADFPGRFSTRMRFRLTVSSSSVFSPVFALDTREVFSGPVVAAWGRSNEGQVSVPTGLSGVKAVAGGSYYSLALKNDGTLVAWGSSDSGANIVPAGLSGIKSISAWDHSLVVMSNGTVVAWGWNNRGQTNVPAGLAGVIAVAAGSAHSLALRGDGSVVGWGDNTFGQTNIPSGLSGVIGIAAGASHCVAFKKDGSVVAWGYGFKGTSKNPQLA